MLLVAFSRRMCCSLAWRVSTNARRPAVSRVSPTSRPGSRRTSAVPQARNPNAGPPKFGWFPSPWPSPTTMSAPSRPGGSSTPAVSGSKVTSIRAPTPWASSAAAATSSTTPKKLGWASSTAAVWSLALPRTSSRSVWPSRAPTSTSLRSSPWL